MDLLIWTAFAVVTLWSLAYNRASLTTFTAAFAAVMLIGSFAGTVSALGWLVFLAIAIPLNITSVRQQYITQPILKVFRKIMPEMSSTEKEAIDAGTTWWEADLFRGAPDWNKLHSFPQPQLTAEEQAFLDGPCEEVCRMTDDWEITHKRTDLSPEIWQYLKDNKFFAMIIKKEYGGLEFSAYAQGQVLQKLTSKSTILSSIVGVPNSLGPGELLQHYGTEEQKNYYLPRLAEGKEIPCFALTSPEAGSDAGSIPDTGIVCKGEWEGKEVLGMRLTWNKRYITLAPVATVLGLAFKLEDPEGLLGGEKELGITCALIPTHTPGVDIGRRHFPLNVPFQNGPTRGDDIFVPIDYIIGGAKMAGQGWRMLVECLSVGRAITLPSNSTGGIKSSALASGSYSRIRRQFKLPIGKMEGIEEPLARIVGNAYMADAACTLSTGAIGLGEKPSVVSAMLKYHLTEKARESVNDAMDIHGGKGICLGPNNYLGRGYQGTPVAITVEGANILTRNLMIYGQGAIRCHPFVLEEMLAAHANNPKEALDRFDKALFGHIGFAISNGCRAIWLALTNAKVAGAPHNDATKKYYQQMTRFSSTLALMSDVSMAVLGGDLKRKERVSARLGDVLSMLYLASATLKRYDDEGRNTKMLPLAQWALEDCLYKAQKALLDLLDNFPNRVVGFTLKHLLFPYGGNLKRPSDTLDHKLARFIQTPSAERTELANNMYITREEGNAIGMQEAALDDILAAEPVFEKVCRGLNKKLPFMRLDEVASMGLEANLISDTEAELLKRAETGRLRSINVDDFDPSELPADKALWDAENQPTTEGPKAA